MIDRVELPPGPMPQEREPSSKIGIGGVMTFECFNPDGSIAWREVCKNGTTLQAINNILDIYLGSTPGNPRPTSQLWYMGLINGTGISGTDTMASGGHTGWTENLQYSETTRPQWAPGTAVAQTVSNQASVVFTINGTTTINGGFLVSDNTKNGTSGVLFATALFSIAQSLQSGQALKVTYTVSGTGN